MIGGFVVLYRPGTGGCFKGVEIGITNQGSGTEYAIVLRRALFMVVAFASLVGCATHSSTLPPIDAGGATPFVNQGDGQNRWLTFPMSKQVSRIARGHDGAMWLTSATQIVRVDMSGNEHDISVNGAPGQGPLTANPDGNIYFAEALGTEYAIGQITPGGVETDFPIGGNSAQGSGQVESMTSGSDGAIWMTREYFNQQPISTTIARLTTTGVYTEFPVEPYIAYDIGRGPDKNLWVHAYLGPNAINFFLLKVYVASGTFTAYPVPSEICCGAPAFGADGLFWMGGRTGNMYSMDTSGNITTYATGVKALDGPAVAGPNKMIYLVRFKLYEWSTVKKRITAQISNPDRKIYSISALAIGPDDQLWGDDGLTNVYVRILHAIVASPSSIFVSPGSSLPVSVIERKSRQRSFTAVSNDPTIATVSGNGEAFSVTGISPGSTTITISDQIGNSLDVSVTVN